MSYPVVCVRSVEKVGYIENILRTESHNGFPVVDVTEVRFHLIEFLIVQFLLYYFKKKSYVIHLNFPFFICPCEKTMHAEHTICNNNYVAVKF